MNAPFKNFPTPRSSSRAATAGDDAASSSRLVSSPAPFSPLECDAPTGSSTIFTPSFIQGGLARRTEGRSPTDRLNRDIDGLASFSPWTVSRDHWWRA